MDKVLIVVVITIISIVIIFLAIEYLCDICKFFARACVLMRDYFMLNKLITTVVLFLIGIQVIMFSISSNISIILRTIVIVCSLVIMFITLGSMTVLLDKIANVLMEVKDDRFAKDFFIILLATSIYWPITNYFSDSSQLVGILIISFQSISYLLVLKSFYTILIKPFGVFTKNQPELTTAGLRRMLKYIIAVSLILFAVLLINAASIVFCLSQLFGAYNCSLSYIEALYFTAITFTTIGYGDIYPTQFPSQLLSVIFALSSVFILIIYIASLLSLIGNANQNNRKKVIKHRKKVILVKRP